MFCPSCEPCRHGNPRLVKCRLRDIPQECLVKRPQRLLGIGQHIPRSRFTFIYPEIIVRIYQTSRQSAEENTNLKVRHVRMPFDDTPVVRVTVQKKQSIFLAKRNTRLIQQTIVQSDILPFRFRRDLHYFKRLQRDIIRLCKCHHIRNEYCC